MARTNLYLDCDSVSEFQTQSILSKVSANITECCVDHAYSLGENFVEIFLGGPPLNQ